MGDQKNPLRDLRSHLWTTESRVIRIPTTNRHSWPTDFEKITISRPHKGKLTMDGLPTKNDQKSKNVENRLGMDE